MQKSIQSWKICAEHIENHIKTCSFNHESFSENLSKNQEYVQRALIEIDTLTNNRNKWHNMIEEKIDEKMQSLLNQLKNLKTLKDYKSENWKKMVEFNSTEVNFERSTKPFKNYLTEIFKLEQKIGYITTLKPTNETSITKEKTQEELKIEEDQAREKFERDKRKKLENNKKNIEEEKMKIKEAKRLEELKIDEELRY